MTEHSIFILNAFIGPLVWWIDPWSIKKYFQKKFMMQRVKKLDNKIVLTQQEANKSKKIYIFKILYQQILFF